MLSLTLVVAVAIISISTCQQGGLNENDVCNNMRPPWRCKKLQACPEVLDSVKQDIPPQLCNFKDGETVVCCPASVGSPNTASVGSPNTTQQEDSTELSRTVNSSGNRQSQSKSAMMCAVYAESVFEKAPAGNIDLCNRLEQPLIVGGERARPREFPHMAQIGFGSNSSQAAWLCGGSLISTRYVLGAAHCTEIPLGVARWARLGELDTASTDDDASPRVYEIVQRLSHPDYYTESFYSDIALFKLNRDVKFNAYIRPICLHTAHALPKNAVATGWGRTQWGGRQSSYLLKVTLNILGNAQCNTSYLEYYNTPKLKSGILDASMFCAGDQDNKDTCQGDSGGPLQFALREPYCMHAQVGVVSFGKECGNRLYPGVYTRVSHFVPWIEPIVWP